MNKLKAAKSLKKPPPIVAPNKPPGDETKEANCQMELELCWCVHQLENALRSGKLSKKLEEDARKNLKTLKSNNAPLVKKRQVMKSAFGDYRSKMKDEEKKLALGAKQVKFTPYADATKKSSFVKKCAILTSGKKFRFNFEDPESGDGDSVDVLPATSLDENSTQNNNLSVNLEKDLKVILSSEREFKFNFNVDEINADLDMNSLSIKS